TPARATRIETRKKVEPRRSLWWEGIAKDSVRAATAAAAGQPAAVLVPSGREGGTEPAVVRSTQSCITIFLRERGVREKRDPGPPRRADRAPGRCRAGGGLAER